MYIDSQKIAIASLKGFVGRSIEKHWHLIIDLQGYAVVQVGIQRYYKYQIYIIVDILFVSPSHTVVTALAVRT